MTAMTAQAMPGISRGVRIVSWVLPPVLMAGVYTIFALTSDADNTGKAWMAIGFGFVLVIWLVFRILVEQTALARAVASGDAERLLRVTERRTDPAALAYRALAHELRGDWPAALAAAREARPQGNPPFEVLAAAVRVAALVETGDVAAARRTADDELEPAVGRLDKRLHPAPNHHAMLARARLLLAEHQRDAADAELSRVIDDIRAGDAIRARALALRTPT